MSNLFELLVTSSKDHRFPEWIKCFEVLFGVPADQIMTDYNQLFSLVNVTTNTYQYKNETEIAIDGMDVFDYDWITLLPNRKRC